MEAKCPPSSAYLVHSPLSVFLAVFIPILLKKRGHDGAEEKHVKSLSKREAMRGNLFSIGGKSRFPSLCFLYISQSDAPQSRRLLFNEEQLPAPIPLPEPLSVRAAFPHKQDPPTMALEHVFLSRRHSWRPAGACPGGKENFLAVRLLATILCIFAIDCVLFLGRQFHCAVSFQCFCNGQ